MRHRISLATLNDMTVAEFTAALAAIFEQAPWVAEQAALKRPFAQVPDLHDAMAEVVRNAGDEAQLKLIRAHPGLVGKAALRAELTEESACEQSGAGLHQCSREEYQMLQALSASYKAKFGFPYVVAEREHDRRSIIENFAKRLARYPRMEMRECIEQIIKINGFRLADLVQ